MYQILAFCWKWLCILGGGFLAFLFIYGLFQFIYTVSKIPKFLDEIKDMNNRLDKAERYLKRRPNDVD